MAIDWQQHWDDLNARQQEFLLLVYERECEEARYYKSQKAMSDPKTKGGEWRWQEHGIVGGAFKQALAEARIPAVSDLGKRVWQAGYKDQGVGATYALLEARGWLERRYTYRHHPRVGHYEVLEVRLTRQGRKLASLHSAYTQRPPGERWRDELYERVETLLHSPQPCRDWLHSLFCEASVGDAPNRRNGLTPLNAFLSAQRLYYDMVQVGQETYTLGRSARTYPLPAWAAGFARICASAPNPASALSRDQALAALTQAEHEAVESAMTEHEAEEGAATKQDAAGQEKLEGVTQTRGWPA